MNTKIILQSFIAALLLLQISVYSQKVLDPIDNPNKFKIQHVGSEQGLSSAFLASGYMDRFGFVWVGGQYGLDVYDGYSFKNVRMQLPDGKSAPIEYVYSIIEDHQGDLWFGGQNGLYRYDRARDQIHVYNIDNADPANNPYYRIYQDAGGLFWIYTANRVYTFSTDSYEFTPTDIEYNNTYWVYQVLRDQLAEEEDGTIWLPALSNGLYMYDPSSGTIKNFRHDPDNPQSLSSDIVENVILDEDGSVWIATWGGGLNKLVDKDKGTFEHFRHDPARSNSIIDDRIFSMMVDESGVLWVAGRYGFSRYIKGSDSFQSYQVPNKYFPYSSNLDFVDFYEIIEDPDGLIWLRTGGHKGTYCFDPVNESLYRFLDLKDKAEGLHGGNWAFSIFPDDNGLIWVINEEGVNIIEKTQNKPFFHFNHEVNNPNSLNYPAVTSIFLDKNNTLWAGSFGAVLNRWDQFDVNSSPAFRQYSPRDRLYAPELILSIAEDDYNTIWYGTLSSGLFKFNRQSGKSQQFIYKINDTLQFNFPAPDALYKDSYGYLWIGTRGWGTYVYNVKGDELHYLPRSADDTIYSSMYNAMTILEDRSGNMWFGHFWSGGITKFPKSERNKFFTNELPKFDRYTSDPDDPTSLSASQVLQISEDKYGRIWVGTTSGLNLFKPDDETFISFGLEDGLPNDCICGILEDDQGNLWISTLKGLCKLELSDGYSREIIQSVKIYDMNDGVKGTVFHEKSCYKSEDGWMFFGSFNGMTVFHPDSIKDNTVIPVVYITNLSINDKPVYSYKNVTLEKSLQETEQVELSYKQNFLSFEYVALNYIHAEGNQYKYMMEGLDEDWVEAGTRRYAEYRDLKPGEYTFRVKGSNDDGVWNEEGASIGIIINPPWYRTVLAYILYVILLALLVLLIIRWRTNRLKKENIKLDGLVKERTKVIQDQNEEIKSTNAELEEQKEEIMAINAQLEEQKEEVMATNSELEEQKEELEQQKEELQITLDQLKETQAQLIQSEKLAALGGLVAGVAHEINTPVSIGLTAASSLEEETQKMADLYKKDKISRADFKDYLNTANQSAKLILSNMQRTADMVQSFKQVSADQSTEQKRNFFLKSYTEDVIRSLYPRLKRRKIQIDLDIDEKLELDSFPGAFSQIITNLVLNSLTHGFDDEQEGKIGIEAGVVKNKLNLEYSDNGRGIPAENLTRIFEPFFTTNKKIGTGLGMHIVYNLVTQKLNGTIDCTSEVGAGTRFDIVVPVK